jgi:alpha-amylase
VVYNHAGYGSRYLTDPRTAGWLRSEERGTCGRDDLTSCLSGLPDFRTEHAEVARFLMDHQLAWARRAGLDGFRLDTVKHVDHPFWREHRRRTRAELFPGFFLVGEVWGGDAEVLDPWFSGDEMDAGFDFSFQGSVLGWVQGRGRTVAFDRYLLGRDRVRDGFLLSHFLSSHDVPGALFQLDGDKELFRLAAALQMTARGLPVVYYGEEVGRRGGDWPENRGDMPWGDRPVRPGAGLPRDEALREDYRRLIAIRRAHPALWRGRHESVSSDGDVLVFARRDAGGGGEPAAPHPAATGAPPRGVAERSGDVVIVASNRGRVPVRVSIAAPPRWQEVGVVREEWSGEELPISASAPVESETGPTAAPFVQVEVPARGFLILAAAPRRP